MAVKGENVLLVPSDQEDRGPQVLRERLQPGHVEGAGAAALPANGQRAAATRRGCVRKHLLAPAHTLLPKNREPPRPAPGAGPLPWCPPPGCSSAAPSQQPWGVQNPKGPFLPYKEQDRLCRHLHGDERRVPRVIQQNLIEPHLSERLRSGW